MGLYKDRERYIPAMRATDYLEEIDRECVALTHAGLGHSLIVSQVNETCFNSRVPEYWYSNTM